MDGLGVDENDRNHDCSEDGAAERTSFPVVAIGVPAGSTAAVERIVAALAIDLGAAYVVVQHARTEPEILSTEPLARAARLPVIEPVDGTTVEADRIYVIPPRKPMILSGGNLLLTDDAQSVPIDVFMRSLAHECGNRAAAVLLAGTGSDGTRGVRAVKNAGGVVLVQDSGDVGRDAGVIAAELARVVPLLAPTPSSAPEQPTLDDGLRRVLAVLAETFGVDFACYKTGTLARRIGHRAELTSAGSTERYAELLASNAGERRRLYRDLLIGVTGFFRDRESYAALEQAIRASLFQETASEVRVWVAGCATGEEAYSIAILLDEARSERGWTGSIRLFATDIQPDALKHASAGRYAAEALAGLSRERIERYFAREPSGRFRVTERLREMTVFASHNLLADAPFTQLDLICCRNVLIYLQPAAQARVLALFHFGLRTGGLLFLGPSETLGSLDDELEPVAADANLYAKRRNVRLPAQSLLAKADSTRRRRPAGAGNAPLRQNSAVDAYESLLERFIPAAFLLDDSFRLLHCFRGAERLLSVKGGPMSTSLPGLLDGRLKTAVSGLLERFKQDGDPHAVNLRGEESYRLAISAVPTQRSSRMHALIEVTPLGAEGPAACSEPAKPVEYVESLERDLELAQAQLQVSVEELEAANEELQASNEELVASNEELQSTNEELRSVNEELNTVNLDHQQKIADLTEVTADLENLLHAINVGVLFLDSDLTIRRANRRIGELLHPLLHDAGPHDAGRSFTHFTNNLDAPSIVETARRVLETGEPAEDEIKAASGRTLLLNVIPHAAEGGGRSVVLTLVDITSRKAAESEARRLSAIVRNARDAIVSYSLDGRIVSWNSGAERLFGYSEPEAVGQDVRLIVPDDLQAETARILAETRNGRDVAPFETVRRAKDGTRLNVLVSVAPTRNDLGSVTGASVIAIDITARKYAEDRAAMAIEQREKFLALLSHELRNPLMAMVSANEVLSRSQNLDQMAVRAQQIISRQITQMSRLLEDTLDASRMRHDKIELQRKRLDLRTVLDAAMDVARPGAARESVRLSVEAPPDAVPVRADAARMQQVIVNLTQNAINHSTADQEVRVALCAANGVAVIRVEDQGAGIAREALPHIFEPFFQASRRSASGMGLGLSLARSIARAHGGDIVAASAGVGHGAQFEVRLPLVDELGETATDLPVQHTNGATPPTVVLIDDDAESRESVAILLRSSGYRVLEAEDGVRGLHLIEEAMPSVAVVDIGLPDISGLEVARRVRRRFGSKQVRLVALTGFGRQDDREAAIEAGCDMHLVKPIDFPTLESVIAYQVSR